MKNIFLIALLFCFVLGGLVSCDDSESLPPIIEVEDTSTVVVEYDVTLPLDSVNYRFVEVEFDAEEMADELGYASTEELVTAFGTVEGTPGVQVDNEIQMFTVNGSTGFDYTEGMTAAGFGYWYDMNGDVIAWGDNAYFFTEMNTESFVFLVGQFPGRLATGETYSFELKFKNGDNKIFYEFDITVGDYFVEEVPEAEIVETYDVGVEALKDNNFAVTPIDIDFATAASAMGISEEDLIADGVFYGVNADGSYTSQLTSNAGFFFNLDGDVCDYGEEGATMFIEYDTENGVLNVGQYPNATVEGEVYTSTVGLMYNDEVMVQYNVSLTILAYQDPETAPTGDPTEVTNTFDISMSYAADWSANASQDVKDILRDAFKMTTYQIHTAIENGELVLSGLNADQSVYTDEEGNIASTANYPGHWYAENGDVTTFGDETNVAFIYSELGHTNETLQFNVGIHPDNSEIGDTITYTQIAELNGGKATFTFNITVTE